VLLPDIGNVQVPADDLPDDVPEPLEEAGPKPDGSDDTFTGAAVPAVTTRAAAGAAAAGAVQQFCWQSVLVVQAPVVAAAFCTVPAAHTNLTAAVVIRAPVLDIVEAAQVPPTAIWQQFVLHSVGFLHASPFAATDLASTPAAHVYAAAVVSNVFPVVTCVSEHFPVSCRTSQQFALQVVKDVHTLVLPETSVFPVGHPVNAAAAVVRSAPVELILVAEHVPVG